MFVLKTRNCTGVTPRVIFPQPANNILTAPRPGPESYKASEMRWIWRA